MLMKQFNGFYSCKWMRLKNKLKEINQKKEMKLKLILS